ncbi:hypothetical protein ACWEOE_36200 [Amycolatopsis sp. NPDC004368]
MPPTDRGRRCGTSRDTTQCALSLLPEEVDAALRVQALYYGPLSPVVTRTTGTD